MCQLLTPKYFTVPLPSVTILAWPNKHCLKNYTALLNQSTNVHIPPNRITVRPMTEILTSLVPTSVLLSIFSAVTRHLHRDTLSPTIPHLLIVLLVTHPLGSHFFSEHHIYNIICVCVCHVNKYMYMTSTYA